MSDSDASELEDAAVSKVYGRIITPRSTYLGEMHDGKPWGQGRVILGQRQSTSARTTQIVLDGEFVNGALEGHGTMCSSLAGKLLYSYSGAWSGGSRDGYGSMVYSNGSRYTGHFCMGKKHGLGLCLWPNGNSFFGYFNKGIAEGLGEAMYCDGSVIVGIFENQVLSGVGAFWNGSERFTGLFSNGVIQEIFTYSIDEENVIYRDDDEDYGDAETEEGEEWEEAEEGEEGEEGAEAEEAEAEAEEDFLRGMRSPQGRRPHQEEEGKRWSSEEEEEQLWTAFSGSEAEEEGEEEQSWSSEEVAGGSAVLEFASVDAIEDDFELAKHILRIVAGKN